jgi:hypothetical protein
MKIDLKKPIHSSLFSMAITFLLSMIILCVTKPDYIMEISKEGKSKKNIYLLFTYSMLFSVLIGIAVLLCTHGSIVTKSHEPFMAFNQRSYRPTIYSPR